MTLKEFSYITIFTNWLSYLAAYCISLNRSADKVMHDRFWIGVWPGINEEMLDYMVMALVKVLRKGTK